MKKLLLAALFTLAVGVQFNTAVFAQDAVIENTGPGSNNEIIIDDSCTTEVTNDNDVDINVDTDQDANSGDANNDGNTNGGNSNSGDASNDSDVDADVTIDNSNDADCDPSTDEPEEGDDGNGDGGEGGSGTTTPRQPHGGAVLGSGTGGFDVLPDTPGANTTVVALAGMSALAAIALAIRSARFVFNR